LNGYPTNIVYLKHNPDFIHWIQCDEPSEQDGEQENSPENDSEKQGEVENQSKNKWFDITKQNLYSFFANCPEQGETKQEFVERLEVYLSNLNPPVIRSPHTIRSKDLRRLFETKKIKLVSKDNKNLIVKGENA